MDENAICCFEKMIEEKNDLIKAIRDITYVDSNGMVHNSYEHYLDLSEKHPILLSIHGRYK